MKLALVYNPKDNKLQESSYSYVYKGMFDAIRKRFDCIRVTEDCSAQDIEADVILFYDTLSTHDITIDGVKNHKAVKVEYFSDPHQKEVKGIYQSTGLAVHKLGRKQRVKRAISRGVKHIISPVKQGFYKYLGEYIGADLELIWFPPSPSFTPSFTPLIDRKIEVLGNGSTWAGGLKCYDFRKWAFEQEYITYIDHCLLSNTLKGKDYHKLLSQYAGALALSEYYPVPKYFEIPLAGCVAFVQYQQDYEELGFRHLENCVVVDKENLALYVKMLTNEPESFQNIVNNSIKLASKYTADKFANFLYEKLNEA